MCGIVAAIAETLPRPDRALAAMAHRGPDAEGSWSQGRVWLGHRRLSIIDLTPEGAQPMAKPGCGAICFNGEIYDHDVHRRSLEGAGVRFDGRSDTEVLLRGLALRGIDFLRGLHGMYAFAWLDPNGRRLWLARDHAGMKPLYVWQSNGRLAAASEVRALAVVVRELGSEVRPNGAALAQFLAWGSVPEPITVLDGIEMVPADTAVSVEVASSQIVETRRIGTVEAHDPPADAVGAVRQAVHAAAARHLVADTPVALFLSGGLDSGILALETARPGTISPTAITVVLGSRGTQDEPGIERQVCSRIGVPLHTVPVEDWSRQLLPVLASKLLQTDDVIAQNERMFDEVGGVARAAH